MAFVRYENVNKIKQLAYSYWRLTLIRMNYSPSDYRNHCISWNFQTFYRTIWRLLNAWSVIVAMIIGYVRCFDELSKFNQTAKTLFFFGEIINKTATIFVCLFYSKQIDMNLFSSSCVLVAIIIFVLMNYVYYRLAKLPSYNRYCYRLILSWFVRIQTFDDRSIKRLGLYRQHRSRFWLKTNFFLQTMMTNHFGFTCGNLFIIDKFKNFELLLVNLPWIMLFYKKIFS
uniref:Uncharacterized protein LOC113792539 n=1 Tax=Dermatophagoides pteronyssinus TaxID=6956 RepID=A0A6P6XYV8_DERPT|nr:uncharacterized protein LOC113792539 [Dermatophagoides pteronyssinus]